MIGWLLCWVRGLGSRVGFGSESRVGFGHRGRTSWGARHICSCDLVRGADLADPDFSGRGPIFLVKTTFFLSRKLDLGRYHSEIFLAEVSFSLAKQHLSCARGSICTESEMFLTEVSFSLSKQRFSWSKNSGFADPEILQRSHFP